MYSTALELEPSTSGSSTSWTSRNSAGGMQTSLSGALRICAGVGAMRACSGW